MVSLALSLYFWRKASSLVIEIGPSVSIFFGVRSRGWTYTFAWMSRRGFSRQRSLYAGAMLGGLKDMG